MAISFTKAIVDRLQREIADIERKVADCKRKNQQAQAKIKQLQRDMKLSQSHQDLSSKMTRTNKLHAEIKTTAQTLAELGKQLAEKKALLKQQQAKKLPQAEA